MFENELGVDKSKGMDSYDYMVTQRAIMVDGVGAWIHAPATVTPGSRTL